MISSTTDSTSTTTAAGNNVVNHIYQHYDFDCESIYDLLVILLITMILIMLMLVHKFYIEGIKNFIRRSHGQV